MNNAMPTTDEVKALVTRLRAGGNDPMWDAHCEMDKRTINQAADLIERLARSEPAVPVAEGSVCAARTSVGANDPQECDWPVCGCDPRAQKVLDALHEQGLALSPSNARKALDDLHASSSEVLALLKKSPAMQGREHISIGSRFADAIASAKIALSSPLYAHPPRTPDVEAVGPEAIDRMVAAFNCGLVSVPDVNNTRGYTVRYQPQDAMRAAIAAMTGEAGHG